MVELHSLEGQRDNQQPRECEITERKLPCIVADLDGGVRGYA